MKVFAIVLFGTSVKPPSLLAHTTELSSFGFFKRGTIKEFIMFVSREVIGRTQNGERQSIAHQAQEGEKFFCHAFVNTQNIGCAVLTDGDYPQRVAFSLILKAIEELVKNSGQDVGTKYTTDANISLPILDTFIQQYQTPEKVDSIMQIEKDLDETKTVLMKSIDQLLVRGEKLDDLAQKSQDLSFQSKAFMKKSQDLNSCCTII